MWVIDFKLSPDWDLELSAVGDISATDSIVQAVRVRLLWFFQEWRLGPRSEEHTSELQSH